MSTERDPLFRSERSLHLRQLIEELIAERAEKGPFCIPLDNDDGASRTVVLVMPANNEADTEKIAKFILIDSDHGYLSLKLTTHIHQSRGEDKYDDPRGAHRTASLGRLLDVSAVSGKPVTGSLTIHPEDGVVVHIGKGVYRQFNDVACTIETPSEYDVTRAMEASLAYSKEVNEGQLFTENRTNSQIRKMVGLDTKSSNGTTE